MRNVVGPVVRGEDFFGRENFVAQVWEKLEATNVLLAGPRRFGKTSVMCHLFDYPKPGYKVIHIDLEPAKEPVDFVATILAKLREDKKLSNFLAKRVRGLHQILKEVEVKVPAGEGVEFTIALKEELKKDWREIGEALLKELEVLDEKLVIILDEFAIMVENFLDGRLAHNEVREFLYWFRKVRIDPGLTKCRFVIGSSISIDHRLSALGVVAVFNDFERMVLCELEDNKAAGRFVDELFKGKKVAISTPARRQILALVGPPVPYFIQVMVSEIVKRFAGKGRTVSSKDVAAVYHDTVLGVSCKTYFQHYYDRLKYYIPESEKQAKAMLKHLALSGTVPREELYQQFLKEGQQLTGAEMFNSIMSDLENDFYIRYKHTTSSYVFFSKILRDWWLRYYSL